MCKSLWLRGPAVRRWITARHSSEVKMGGGGQLTEQGETGSKRAGCVYTWEEVQSHSSRTDQWLVIDRKVYNTTQWAKRHPGGFHVISHYAGQDATVKQFVLFFNTNPFFRVLSCFLWLWCCKCQWWNVSLFFQEAFTAFHPDLKFVQKFLKPLLIGELAATEPSQDRNKNVSTILWHWLDIYPSGAEPWSSSIQKL